MNNSKHEAVRAKIIMSCPELMELSFGCGFEDGSKLISLNHPFALNTFVSILRKDGYEMTYETSGIEPNHSKILGHPIRLSHVLRAIEKTIDSNDYHLGMDGAICIDEFDEDDDCVSVEKARWDLTKDDLSLQSPEVWNFLFKILCE